MNAFVRMDVEKIIVYKSILKITILNWHTFVPKIRGFWVELGNPNPMKSQPKYPKSLKILPELTQKFGNLTQKSQKNSKPTNVCKLTVSKD
jgi:hypothetical protein